MELGFSKSRQKVMHIVFAFAVVISCIFFVRFLFVESALAWGTKQDAFKSAVGEIVILIGYFSGVLLFMRRKWHKIVFVSLGMLAFSHVHSFLLPFLAGCLFFLMIWMTGYLLCNIFATKRKREFAGCFVMGMSGLIVLIAVCSLLKIGTAEKLRVVYKVLFVIECILCGRKLLNLAKEIVIDDSKSDSLRNSVWDNIFLAITISALMIQVGRANISQDYDFLWYGARADDILAPYTGIYDKIISTPFVYYYPKAFEALSLAFFCDETYGFVYAVNLMFSAALLYIVYKTAKLITTKDGIPLFVVMCCAVTAGIMNMATTAKQDIATLFLQMCVVYYGILTIKEREGSMLLLAVSAGVLSYTFKTTSVVFSSALIFIVVVAAVCRKVKIKWQNIMILLIPIAAVVAIFYRTYMLSGILLPLTAKNLQEMLGFSLKYPYVNKSGVSVTVAQVLTTPLFWERFQRVLRLFFWPNSSDTNHVIIAWGGYLFVILWFSLVLNVIFHPIRTWYKMRGSIIYSFLLITLIVVSILSGGSMMLLSQLDGNYFMLMYALTFLQVGMELSYFSFDFRKISFILSLPLVVCGVLMCIASHWSWSLGFTPVDWDNPGYYDHGTEMIEYYESIQIDQICEELEKQEKKPRVMIFSSEFPFLQEIPAVSESWPELIVWGNRSVTNTPEALYEYYDVCDMEFLLVEAEYAAENELVQTNLLGLAEEGYLSIYMQQGDYYLLSFTEEKNEQDVLLIEMLMSLSNDSESE